MPQTSSFYSITSNNLAQFNFVENFYFLRNNIFNPKFTKNHSKFTKIQNNN